MNGGIILQNKGSGSIRSTVDNTRVHIDTRLLDEVLLFVLCQLVPIPPRDDIVQLIGHTLIVHLHTIRTHPCGLLIITIVGIQAGLYVEQFQLTVRACRDGQRNLHLLRVGCSRTSVSRYHLVVDINLTLDIPIVSRRLHITVVIDAVVGIAVVHNTLRLMDEVTRGLHLLQVLPIVSVALVGTSLIAPCHCAYNLLLVIF